jgi:glycosyltransferase involved in cell wall biosynthesis
LRSKETEIQQILDPSHRNWVLGGIFSDLRVSENKFIPTPIFLPSPTTLKGLCSWLLNQRQISRHEILFFSSLTPLINYFKFSKTKDGKVIVLWFTHIEGNLSKRERRALEKSDLILVHSERAKKDLLLELPNARVQVVVGALQLSRFKTPAIGGKKIAWVGTPNSRKNPHLLLEIAKRDPSLEFRLIGRDWSKSVFWEQIKKYPNIEYREVSGALQSSDFDYCNRYLMLSEVEGGPMPLLESLAAGLIPICSNTGFVWDLLAPLGLETQIVNQHELSEVLRVLYQSENILIPKDALRESIQKYDFKRLSALIVEGAELAKQGSKTLSHSKKINS